METGWENEGSINEVMKLIARIDNETLPVEVEKKDGRYILHLGQKQYHVDVSRPTPTSLSLLVDGAAFEVVLSREDHSWSVTVGSQVHIIEVEGPRSRRGRAHALQTDSGEGTGKKVITAQMPGKVVQVLVGLDDEVKFGQGLLVIEAMKMQNEIKSPKAGRVIELAAAVGKPVNSGDFLIAIE